jgi:hypothetical protein
VYPDATIHIPAVRIAGNAGATEGSIEFEKSGWKIDEYTGNFAWIGTT